MISIIVPIYNNEQYLVDCVEGVLNQSYKDWELLLINDGSTDGSRSLCALYAEADSRIKVINKSNTGVSDTRNRGLDVASGEYVIFIDSDDYWCDSECLEKLVSLAIANEADVVRGEYIAINSTGELLFINNLDKAKEDLKNIILDSATFLEHILHREFFIPLCLMRLDAINNIRFNTRRAFLEDLEFFLNILQRQVRCFYTPLYFYAYRKHPNSVSNNFNKKRLSDAFDICALYLQLFKMSIDESLVKSFPSRSWDYYYLTLRTMAIEDSYFNCSRQLCEELKVDNLRYDLIQVMPFIISDKKWLHRLSPFSTICYFRLRYIVGKFLKR